MLTDVLDSLKRHGLLWLSAILFLISSIADQLFLRSFVINPTPQLEPIYLLRSVLLMGISGLLVFAVLRSARGAQPLPGRSHQRLLTLAPWGVLAFGIACVVLFLVSPRLFASAGYEDRPVEYLSALTLFVAAAVLVIVAGRVFKSDLQYRHTLVVICVLMAFGFFVIGMEEISWFQRIIGFDTPDAFAGNRQDEFNFHNFASNLFEELYYFGGFFLLVLLPFLVDVLGLHRKLEPFRLFIPSLPVLYSSALMAAFNYHLWNRTSTQYTFFVTAFIMLYYTRRAIRQQNATGKVWLLPGALLLVYLIAQILFLLRGQTLSTPWTVSEYKELLLPVGLGIYCLELVFRSRRFVRRAVSVRRQARMELN